MDVGFISARLADTDGVSLEIARGIGRSKLKK